VFSWVFVILFDEIVKIQTFWCILKKGKMMKKKNQ